MDSTLSYMIANFLGLAMLCMAVWLIKQLIMGIRFVIKVMVTDLQKADSLEMLKDKNE